MSNHLSVSSIKDKAETLKEYLWEYFFMKGFTHKGIKDAMNELLDLLDELPEEEKP